MDLGEYLKQSEKHKMEFALEIGISLGHLDRILSRNRRASIELAKKIEEVTGGKVTKEEIVFPEDF